MKSLVLLFFSLTAVAEPIRVGILDTGFSQRLLGEDKLPLCDTGHFDVASGEPRVVYKGSHGTAVAKAFAEEAGRAEYCLVIISAVGPIGMDTKSVRAAIQYATTIQLDALNISLEGVLPDFGEYRALKKIGRKGTRIFVAAGNKRRNTNLSCRTYPACYRNVANMIVVGALDETYREVAPYSNYGQRMDLWMPGVVHMAGEEFQGTSFAAPRAMGLYVKDLWRKRMTENAQ